VERQDATGKEVEIRAEANVSIVEQEQKLPEEAAWVLDSDVLGLDEELTTDTPPSQETPDDSETAASASTAVEPHPTAFAITSGGEAIPPADRETEAIPDSAEATTPDSPAITPEIPPDAEETPTPDRALEEDDSKLELWPGSRFADPAKRADFREEARSPDPLIVRTSLKAARVAQVLGRTVGDGFKGIVYYVRQKENERIETIETKMKRDDYDPRSVLEHFASLIGNRALASGVKPNARDSRKYYAQPLPPQVRHQGQQSRKIVRPGEGSSPNRPGPRPAGGSGQITSTQAKAKRILDGGKSGGEHTDLWRPGR
jgi:hypothetical protein